MVIEEEGQVLQEPWSLKVAKSFCRLSSSTLPPWLCMYGRTFSIACIFFSSLELPNPQASFAVVKQPWGMDFPDKILRLSSSRSSALQRIGTSSVCALLGKLWEFLKPGDECHEAFHAQDCRPKHLGSSR